jgi:hypothetical protein
MVEVFKTNVSDREQANNVIEELHKIFPLYKVNFDLEDCDKILRVASDRISIESDQIMDVLKKIGLKAEILEDSPLVI